MVYTSKLLWVIDIIVLYLTYHIHGPNTGSKPWFQASYNHCPFADRGGNHRENLEKKYC